MIVIYPMLTSGSVSPNVLPGITKAIEKYILVYNTDEVLRAAGGTSAGQIIAAGKAAAALLASDDKSDLPGEHIFEQPPGGKKTAGGAGGTTVNVNVPAASSGGSSPRPELKIHNQGDAVSLEPTWLQVTTKKKGLQILGVKVVPFQVASGESMASLIMKDKQLKGFDLLMTKYGRGIARVYHRLMRKFKGRPISGDPKSDVLYASTQYGKNMFVCLNQMDLEDDTFSSPAATQRLHKLGWASFIVLDDVNRRATFCMKQFGGICSVVPYGFMFASLGQNISKVYDDLEDIKKTSGPFFNMKTNRKRVFSEGNVTNVDKYLQLIQKNTKR